MGEKNEIEMMKKMASSEKSNSVFSAFIKLYKNTVVSWIKKMIFDENKKIDAEDIFSELLIELYRRNPFKNFKINKDENKFVINFNLYLKKVIIKRLVSKYCDRKKNKLKLVYCEKYESNIFEIKEWTWSSLEISSNNLSLDFYKEEKNKEFCKERINYICKGTNKSKELEILYKSEIEGCSIQELAKLYKCSENNISTAKWRARKVLKENILKVAS